MPSVTLPFCRAPFACVMPSVTLPFCRAPFACVMPFCKMLLLPFIGEEEKECLLGFGEAKHFFSIRADHWKKSMGKRRSIWRRSSARGDSEIVDAMEAAIHASFV